VTELIETGELARHIARVRKLYADRREALLGALTDVPSIVNIRGSEAASTSSRSSTSASMPRP
jgi:GntR family transcriptional regulator / MocR family aminotransferase